MIVFVALLGLITLLGVQKRKKEEPFLSKEMTTTVNGIFVLCIQEWQIACIAISKIFIISGL